MSELDFPKQLLDLGDREGAVSELSKQLIKKPQDIEAWLLLAKAVDDKEQEADCYRRVLKIEPSNQIARERLIRLVAQPKTENKPQIPVSQKTETILITKTQQDASKSDRKTALGTMASPKANTSGFGFQSRYLTAIGGLGVAIGTLFTWLITSEGGEITNTDIGITSFIGMVTFLAGIIIFLLSLILKTKESAVSSPISSVIAICLWVLLLVWKFTVEDSSIECIFSPPYVTPGVTPYIDSLCVIIHTGHGFTFSMSSLFIAFVTGVVKNPKGKN